MPRPRDARRSARLDPAAGETPDVQEAIVAENASGEDDRVMVTVPSFSREHRHGPCDWMPICLPSGIYYPRRGDPCIIANPPGATEPVIVWWANKSSEPNVVPWALPGHTHP